MDLSLPTAKIFGRSVSFSIESYVNAEPLDGYKEVFKAGGTNPLNLCNSTPIPRDRSVLLRLEAEVMDYLGRWSHYFGLRSEIPFADRSLCNRTQVWRFGEVDHLKYRAPESYLTYLECLPNSERLIDSLILGIGDLMRLARFGIFHSELAPLYHAERSGRRFIWNIGGMLPGTGHLAKWEDSFRYSNLRQSGIADFEHIQRFSCLPIFSEIVNESDSPSDLGFQHHLGNPIFCAFHLVALWHRANRTNLTAGLTQIEHAARRILSEAYEALNGCAWESIEADINFGVLADEIYRVLIVGNIEHGPDLGARSGAYPAPNILKTVYIFSIRAIQKFSEQRKVLERNLARDSFPVIRVKPTPPRSGSHGPSPEDFLSNLRSHAIFDRLSDAGLSTEIIAQLVLSMRLGEFAFPSLDHEEGSEESKKPPTFYVQPRGVLRTLTKLLGKNKAELVCGSIKLRLTGKLPTELANTAELSLKDAAQFDNLWAV